MSPHTHLAAPAGPLTGALPSALVTIALVVVAMCYARGVLVMYRSGRAWRRQRLRLLAGAAGTAVAVAALLPSVERFAENRLATHMVEHMALIVVAAPLLAAGVPGRALWIGLPRRVRAPLARVLHRHRAALAAAGGVLLLPALAWCGHVATLWVWHFPAAYDAALRSPLLHAAEHALFLGTAWLFWWHVVAPSRRRLSPPFATLYVAAAALPSAALGAVLTFAPAPLYPVQAQAAIRAGADALTDQQLAGLIMWVPADVAYLAIAVALFLSWFARGSGPVVVPPDARESMAPVAGPSEGVRR